MIVNFLLRFFASHMNFTGIDDHNLVAGDLIFGPAGLAFADQGRSNFRGKASQRFAGSIHQVCFTRKIFFSR